MSELNKALARRGIEEIWNQGKLGLIEELFAANVTVHDPNVPGGKVQGLDGLRQYVTTYRSAFPDLHFTIEDQIAEGDKVVTRFTGKGTFKNEMMGIAPTGKQATVAGVDIDRFHDGKVVESWGSYDMLGMLQQLGVVPSMTPAGVSAKG
jgi:steroid delta-isomerase-like uncharacterized protein